MLYCTKVIIVCVPTNIPKISGVNDYLRLQQKLFNNLRVSMIELTIRGVNCIIVENDNNNTVIINKQCNILRNPLLFNIASPTLIKQCPP